MNNKREKGEPRGKDDHQIDARTWDPFQWYVYLFQWWSHDDHNKHEEDKPSHIIPC